ncbi:unnamed protein product [Durusdinium trenchii]|uniref:Uncharacterized protein n=2 Tax=Durusdinium trenchii TaxID=1381693 RepID=A0ABP0KW16_9DINO
MGKVKKTHLKNKKAKAKAQGKKTEADGDEVLDAGETSHELKRRHAAERKALQAKIVELKRQRKKLPKKKNKDDKKALTEEMKKLKSEMKLEHQDIQNIIKTKGSHCKSMHKSYLCKSRHS